MLRALHASLSINEPFDACIWAMVLCAFWGMMRFSEVSVTSRSAFDMAKHLTRKDAHFGFDLDSKPYARLDLPSSKMAKPGEIQSIFLIPQEGLCPLAALQNLARVVPAGPNVLKRNIGRCYSDLKPNVPLRNCIGSLRSQDLCK